MDTSAGLTARHETRWRPMREDDLACVAINGTVRFIINDQIEVERRELFSIPAIDHK